MKQDKGTATGARRVLGSAACVVAAAVGLAMPAYAAGTPSPTPSPSRTTSGSPSPSGTASPGTTPTTAPTEHALTGAELRAQIDAANALWSRINSSTSAVAAAMQEVERLTKESNALLETLDKARTAEADATAEADRLHIELDILNARLDRARRIVREWAVNAYTEGDSADVFGMLDALRHDASEAQDPLGDLAYITDKYSWAHDEIKAATEATIRVSASADAAKQRAAEARGTLEDAQAKLTVALAAQKDKLDAARILQMDEIASVGPLAAILVGAKTPEAQAAVARLRTAVGTSATSTSFESGPPCSNDTRTYPNGALPPSALCPIWGAPGESLRPAAAAAFNALSQAYARQTGSPLCVTDSYRSYAQQIAVKASRGRWAATPGTSPHGLGIAVDLCGGIENFGTPAHLWMRQNAPLYGWYHPAALEAGGSLPEPWHWNFAG